MATTSDMVAFRLDAELSEALNQAAEEARMGRNAMARQYVEHGLIGTPLGTRAELQEVIAAHREICALLAERNRLMRECRTSLVQSVNDARKAFDAGREFAPAPEPLILECLDLIRQQVEPVSRLIQALQGRYRRGGPYAPRQSRPDATAP